MMLILLAALGVPLWLVAGALGAGLWSRRTFRRSSGVFAVKCRPMDASGTPPSWPRRVMYARWVHDVLILHQGAALVRTQALPVAGLVRSPTRPAVIKGLGDDPCGARVRLDDGREWEIATASDDCVALDGPFGQLSTGTNSTG